MFKTADSANMQTQTAKSTLIHQVKEAKYRTRNCRSRPMATSGTRGKHYRREKLQKEREKETYYMSQMSSYTEIKPDEQVKLSKQND